MPCTAFQSAHHDRVEPQAQRMRDAMRFHLYSWRTQLPEARQLAVEKFCPEGARVSVSVNTTNNQTHQESAFSEPNSIKIILPNKYRPYCFALVEEGGRVILREESLEIVFPAAHCRRSHPRIS